MELSAVPVYAWAILQRLEAHGYRAYLVGGCVRDLILGYQPADWDICTAARPETVLSLFPGARPTGIRHGTVTVLSEGGQVEVTTFRRESAYSDHRRPDMVQFVTELYTDLSRRDFTMNAMALDIEGHLHDPFGGQLDMAARRIVTVGKAAQRFHEDALRMFRAFRFAARLDYTIPSQLHAAIAACSGEAAYLAPERIAMELTALLQGPDPTAFWRLTRAGLLDHLLTAPGHALPLPLVSLTEIPVYSRWAAVIAWLCRQRRLSVPAAFLRTLRLPTAVCRTHGNGAALALEDPPPDRLAWKRCLAWNGVQMACACAWAGAILGRAEDPAVLQEILDSGECVSLEDLAVSGGELAALGLRGPAIGQCRRALLDHVLTQPTANTTEQLLAMAARGL